MDRCLLLAREIVLGVGNLALAGSFVLGEPAGAARAHVAFDPVPGAQRESGDEGVRTLASV